MRRFAVLMGMLAMLAACGDSSNPMTSEVPAPAAKKGGAASTTSNDGETAYSNGGSGDLDGYSGTQCPNYGNFSWTLWAGQTNNAGTVSITNDADGNILVTYDTNETADLGEVHVYAWTDLADIPDRRPAPGQAPYTAENINADSYTVTIPSSDLADYSGCGDVIYISTHAALVGDGDGGGGDDNSGETAYAGGGGGITSAKGAWWGYVEYTVTCFFDISGTVYEDASDNSDLDAGETGFEGITVNLLDGSGSVIATTTTDADGNYTFENVAGGTGQDYSVQVEGPADHYATENDGGYAIVDLDDCVTDVDFGFIPHFDISGTVAIDASCGDGGVLPEVDITLTSDAGSVTVTTVGGSYSFEDIRGYGDYTITASVPAGFTAEAGADGIALENLSDDVTDASFTYCPIVFDECDTNQDGVVDAAEEDACGGGGPDDCTTNPALCNDDDDFPTWGQDISHVILTFQNADGDLYLIKVDEYPDAGDDDLDNDIDAILAYLQSNNLIPAGSELIGSSIKGGRQITAYYAYGSANTNGTSPDTPPSGYPLTYNGTSDNEGNQNLIDVVVDWADIF